MPRSTIHRHAKKENWNADREKAGEQTRQKAIEKAADAASDNAKLAADLKRDLLLRLTFIAQKYPKDATEVRMQKNGGMMVYKLTDLTRALRDLTEDMPRETAPNELLQSLLDLERGAGA